MEKETEKFINYSDTEIEELKQLISDYTESLKETYAPALSILLPETVVNHANKFLREKRAAYQLDQAAIKDGHANYADKLKKEERARLDAIAKEKAEQAAKEKAIKEQEDAKIKAQIEEDAKIKLARDNEDAERAALNKAKSDAGLIAENDLSLTSEKEEPVKVEDENS